MIIARLKGGLGNQMFIYAASKALAVRNNTVLGLDTVTGFKYDHLYKRSSHVRQSGASTHLRPCCVHHNRYEKYRAHLHLQKP